MNNYEFFMKTDVSKYMGEWIAICKQEIVAHGVDGKKVLMEAKEKFPEEIPLMAKIPNGEIWIF